MKTLRTASARIIVALVISIVALHASADSFDDMFFEVLKKTSSAKPDDIEMLRYFIYHEEHATYIYSRVAEDYVFDGILVAAKGARNRTVPGTSITFDENTCMTPINLFNAAFASSDKFIDQHGSDPYVKRYMKAQTAAAKNQAAAELSSHLPYFDAIPHICHFTFNTNFQEEKKAAEIVTGVATILKDAYTKIKSGDVVGGVAKLGAAGLSNDAACALIDQYVAGGLIANTPVLGDLAQGACSGFVGKVFGAVGAAGGAIMSGINDAGDFISGQSPNMPGQRYYELYWRPRIAEGMAVARTPAGVQPLADSIYGPCVEYFDSHTMSSDSANETCTFQRDRQFTPDVFARVTMEDKTLPEWVNGFVKTSAQACADDLCRGEVETIRHSALQQGRDLSEQRIDLGWSDIQSSLSFFVTSASDAVQRSQQRVRSADKAGTANGAVSYAAISIAVFTPQCLDAICAGEVKSVAAAEVAALNDYQRTHPDASSLNVTREILPGFGKKYSDTIQASKNRKIVNDPNASAVEKLPLLGCKYFLGRSGDWLCRGDTGFASCKTYLARGAASRCINANGGAMIAEPPRVASDLKKFGGCTFVRWGQAYRVVCKSAEGQKLCENYQRGGLKLNCPTGMVKAPATSDRSKEGVIRNPGRH
jgi:hypothetical protein